MNVKFVINKKLQALIYKFKIIKNNQSLVVNKLQILKIKYQFFLYNLDFNTFNIIERINY